MATTRSNANNTNRILITIAAVAAILASTGAVAYIATKAAAPQPQKVVVHKSGGGQPAPQQVANCDDGNIVGMALGGVTGGILGNQVGKGSGNTAATIGGAVGGAYVGKEYIPTRNVTCR